VRTINIKEIKNFVIISDVHLREPENHITKLFIETLDKFILEKKKAATVASQPLEQADAIEEE
jgi:hypothetical protein